MSDILRDAVIKLASDVPELRKHLVPLLERTATEFGTQEELNAYLREHPGADRSNHSVKPSSGTSHPAEKDDDDEDNDEEGKPKLWVSGDITPAVASHMNAYVDGKPLSHRIPALKTILDDYKHDRHTKRSVIDEALEDLDESGFGREPHGIQVTKFLKKWEAAGKR